MDTIAVGLIGTKFMGRAHSHALIDVPHFFDVPYPVRYVSCGSRLTPELHEFARRFGWQRVCADWHEVVDDDVVELVDICTSNATHLPIAVAAARRGKHILCEKPLARNADEARRMLDAAEEAGIVHMVAFNYRRVPAIVLARQMIERGELGRILHFNAVYYQDWQVDPAAPFVWRNDAAVGGSGVHGDMNAHLVDLARYLLGDFAAVCGVKEIFVKERRAETGPPLAVTAEDSAYFLARFQSGALGSFLVTKMAAGYKNFLRLEICGDQGSLVFNLERLNELEFYARRDEPTTPGFRTVLVTAQSHPYLAAWWPAGHMLGWEHTFIHEFGDLLAAIRDRQPVTPTFHDGWRCQLVLDAVLDSIAHARWIDVPEGR